MNDGITVWLNGTGYWFEGASSLEVLLYEHCDSAVENTARDDGVEYDLEKDLGHRL